MAAECDLLVTPRIAHDLLILLMLAVFAGCASSLEITDCRKVEARIEAGCAVCEVEPEEEKPAESDPRWKKT